MPEPTTPRPASSRIVRKRRSGRFDVSSAAAGTGGGGAGCEGTWAAGGAGGAGGTAACGALGCTGWEGVGFVVMSTKLRRAAESRHRATWRPRFGFSLPPSRGRRCFTGLMTTADTAHPHEPHGAGIGQRLNWLRAGVLGANDGIVPA